MATNSTQRYVDNEKSDNFLSGILPIQEVREEVGIDIDVDIEKQIAQLQEAKMQTGIKKVVPVDFDTELGTFFSSIAEEKKDLEEKVAKDEKKITELENLFDTLKKEKKKTILLIIFVNAFEWSTRSILNKCSYTITCNNYRSN